MVPAAACPMERAASARAVYEYFILTYSIDASEIAV